MARVLPFEMAMGIVGWAIVWVAVSLAGCSGTGTAPSTSATDATLCDQNYAPSAPGGRCRASGPTCVGDQIVECFHGDAGDCYQPTRSACLLDTCIIDSTGAHCASCDEVRELYNQELYYRSSVAVIESGAEGLAPGAYNLADQCQAEDCSTITPSHCEIGLGACAYLGKPRQLLEDLANAYVSLGCARATACDCPAQVNATCEMNERGWPDPNTGRPRKYACIVQ